MADLDDLTQFTFTGLESATVPDTSDGGSDLDVANVRVAVSITSRPEVVNLQTSPPRTLRIRPVKLRIEDGVLVLPAGAVGDVRLVANAGLGITGQLLYDVKFGKGVIAGDEVDFSDQNFTFIAPNTDVSVDMTSVTRVSGSTPSGTVVPMIPDHVRLNGSGQLVWSSNGVDIPDPLTLNLDVSGAIASAVTAAMAALVAGAPGALDTLNELAAALGDDPNFATTIATTMALKAPLASPTFTGTVAGITKAMVGLGSVDNTPDASKPVSTAQAAADALKANIASPTFTGTVSGITKAMVGLGGVDNTADASKPVSTAQAAADTAVAAASVAKALVDAKGDLLVGTANDTVARLAVGANNTVLVADSSQAGGVKWGSALTADSLTYNVLDHGIVADGSTSNTTAYATLVSTVVAAGGGIILFPPSTSQYMGSLVINANVPIKVIGYGATLQGPSAGTTVTINTGQTGGSGQTVIVEGLVIKGNADQTTDGVLVRDTSRARIDNCQIVRTKNGVLIQNFAASQNSEGTTIRSTLINDCVTGVKMEIVSGGPSFDETILHDVGINNCTTGIYLPTGSNHVRSCFDATVWVGRTSSTNGVAMYTDADMIRVWGRLGGELYNGATFCSGMVVGPNAFGFADCDLQLHFQGSISPWVDLTPASAGQIAMWRHGLTNYAQSKGTPGGNMLGPHCKSLGDTFPRSGFSMGSGANAPMPGGRDGLFFGSGSAQADTTLWREQAHVLEQGYADSFKTGQNATGSRPSASTHGQGAQFFDTTLNRPIWSDGTNWKEIVGVTDTQTLPNKTLTNPTITNYTESVVAIGSTSTAKTIALTSGTMQTATLTGNCTFTMPTAAAGKSFSLALATGAGSFTATFTGVKWPAATAPTVTTAASKTDVFTFSCFDGSNWIGSVIQAVA